MAVNIGPYPCEHTTERTHRLLVPCRTGLDWSIPWLATTERTHRLLWHMAGNLKGSFCTGGLQKNLASTSLRPRRYALVGCTRRNTLDINLCGFSPLNFCFETNLSHGRTRLSVALAVSFGLNLWSPRKISSTSSLFLPHFCCAWLIFGFVTVHSRETPPRFIASSFSEHAPL